MNQDFVDFYKRWLKKAKSYRMDNLSDYFDKFVTLFILYNFQYGRLAVENGILDKYGRYRDYEMATCDIKRFFDNESFCKNPVVKAELQKIIELIEARTFHIKGIELDEKLIEKVKSPDFEKKSKGILEILYFIRCNLFHGDKSFDPEQKQILLPCIAILEEINKIVFESIRKR